MEQLIGTVGSWVLLFAIGAALLHALHGLRVISAGALPALTKGAAATFGAGMIALSMCAYFLRLTDNGSNPLFALETLGANNFGPVVQALGGLLFGQYALVYRALCFLCAIGFVWLVTGAMHQAENRVSLSTALFALVFSPAFLALFIWLPLAAVALGLGAVLFIAARVLFPGKRLFLNAWIARMSRCPYRKSVYALAGGISNFFVLYYAAQKVYYTENGALWTAGVAAAAGVCQLVVFTFPEKEVPQLLRRAALPIGAVAARWLMCFMALILLRLTGMTEAFADKLYRLFINAADAPLYLTIAKEGYVAAGDNAKLIVFFPLYPLLIKLLTFIVRDGFAASLIISSTCLGVAGTYLYRLLRVEYKDRAVWGMLLFLFVPMGQFFVMGFTESLFMMLSVMTVYYARKRNFLAASIAGFFGALTRSFGILLIVPLIYEYLCGREKDDTAPAVRWDLACSLLIPLGFFIYLCINKAVQGDWFAFLSHQSAPPWWNTPAWVGNNLAQHYAMAQQHQYLGLILYWVQLVYFFVAIAAILYAIRKKMRLTYALYGGLYVLMTYTSGWLISGGRYMACCFPLFIIGAGIENKTARTLLVLASALLSMLYTFLIVQGQAIL